MTSSRLQAGGSTKRGPCATTLWDRTAGYREGDVGQMTLQPGWAGRYFEDFQVGDVYRHPLGRTLSETDNTWLTLLTGNTNQMHFNAHYSAKSEFGRSLVNSGITMALVLGLSVSDLSQQAIANLGWNKVRMPHPVFVGD